MAVRLIVSQISLENNPPKNVETSYFKYFLFIGGHCNANDHNIWQNQFVRVRTDFKYCAMRQCLGDPKCTSDCLHKAVGLSKPCCHCYGSLASCGKYNCYADCKDTYSYECKTCLKKYCEPSFLACSGLPSPL